MADLQHELRVMVRRALTTTNVFDALVQGIDRLPCATASELKGVRKKKGDLWELYCREFLRVSGGFETAELLSCLDDDALARLSLRRGDVGIDLIAFHADGGVSAVQCKFRRKGGVSWREISTFEALCARSGPWTQKIVMTNGTHVTREGRKDATDRTIAQRSFQALPRHQWNAIAGYGEGRTVGVGPHTQTVREARQAWISRLQQQITTKPASATQPDEADELAPSVGLHLPRHRSDKRHRWHGDED